MTYLVIWEYQVDAEKRPDFERHYSEGGTWTRFFSEGRGYQGTTLLENLNGGYVTLDFWESKDAFDAFMAVSRDRYDAIDRECEALTTAERCVGRFTSADSG